MSAPIGAWITIDNRYIFICGTCDRMWAELAVVHTKCCKESANATAAHLCVKCKGGGILEYVYHIYYKCRRCGAWAKRSS